MKKRKSGIASKLRQKEVESLEEVHLSEMNDLAYPLTFVLEQYGEIELVEVLKENCLSYIASCLATRTAVIRMMDRDGRNLCPDLVRELIRRSANELVGISRAKARGFIP